MTPTIPHIQLTVHGGLPGGESWSCGLRTLATADSLGVTKGSALAVSAANTWRGLANNMDTARLFGNCTGQTAKATIDGVTVRRLDADGLTVEQYEGSPTTALVPIGSSTVAFPNQCALAVTLVTARAGRTGKGRIYLPSLGDLTLTGNRFGTGWADLIATAVKTFLDNMNTVVHTATDASNFLAVQSSVASREPGFWTPGAPTGYMGAKIIAIKLGDVVDTQRRRRSGIVESYTTKLLA